MTDQQERDTEREAFEREFGPHHLSRNNVPGSDLSGYENPYTDIAWRAWQARAARSQQQQQADEVREYRELAKLAYRALDDAARVLFTLDPESAEEGEQLRELTKRCADLAVSIFTMTRLPANACPHMAGALSDLTGGGNG